MFIKYMANCLNNQIFLPIKMKGRFNVTPKRLILNIGSFKREVSSIFIEDIDEDTIGLSKYMDTRFLLPDSLIYEVKIDGRDLHIGPIIAFLLEEKKKYISPERLDKLKDYFINYKDIKGAIFICSVDQIDVNNKTIEGFYYDGKQWNTSVFPYPGSIYRKSDIPQNIYDDLIAHIGDRIFNSYFFDKWETWQMLSSYKELREHLPYTEKLDTINDLDRMLESFPEVYLKQTKGYKAKGIIKADKTEEGYNFTYRLKGVTTIKDPKAVNEFITELNQQKRGRNFYIIQQAIKLKYYQNRPFDFRVVLQKDKNKRWGCSGIIARFGKRGSIATNFLLSGYAISGYEALKRVFRMTEREIFGKLQEITDICIAVCETIEKSIGNYGDIGIDVMVDENKKIWVLEVNKTHDHRFPIYSINDIQMYHKIITKPLEYAKSLAGF